MEYFAGVLHGTSLFSDKTM